MNPDKIQKFYLNPQIFKVAIATSVVSILLSFSGMFQSLEWALWDHYFRWRSHEARDADIVIVTIDEEDSVIHSEWPISDALLAQLLKEIKAQEPRIIGLNLFRNLPIGEGQAELQEIFHTTPNLIAAKKTVGTEIAPPEILEKKDQIGFSDLIVDRDGVVRRALVAINSDRGTEASLGTQIAMKYLEQEGIAVTTDYQPKYRMPFDHRQYFRLGKAVFSELERNDGGYVRSDSGGFQLLLNYRSSSRDFSTITMRDLLDGKIPPGLVRDVHEPPLKDRIVLIGITTDSDGNNISTPFDRVTNDAQDTPGVFIHAHIASQFIQGAKYGRPFFRVWSKQGEWFWLVFWAILGAGGRFFLLKISPFTNRLLIQNLLLFGYLTGGAIALVGFSYGSFLMGWWVPVMPVYLAFGLSVVAMGSYHGYELQKLATLDALTQVANRRYFEEYLYQIWWKCERDKKPVALIMCDIDYFKLYNDHYGHQLGDLCLQQVVKTIQQDLRTSDLIARYGGEEFIIVLPNTDKAGACHVAERICQKVVALQVEHQQSPTSPYVTVSCGVSSVIAHPQLGPVELIASADKALYIAKEEGRNRVSFQEYQNLSSHG